MATDDTARPERTMPPGRLKDRKSAAAYIGHSTRTIDRLINNGILPVVRLPVHNGRPGTSRRVLIDVGDLDRLIETSKETAAPPMVRSKFDEVSARRRRG